MSTKSGNQKTVFPNRSSVLRALFVTPILLLALALSSCNDSYPNYNATVDKLLGQSNVELAHALSRPTIDYVNTVAFVNDTLLAVGGIDSVYFVDVRDPAMPAVISVFNIPDKTDNFSIPVMSMDGYVYATIGDWFTGTLFVIDIREPTSPLEANRIEHGVRGRGWVAEDGYLYIGSALGFGVQIWDASVPSDPSMLGVYYPAQARVGLDEIDSSYRLPPVLATPRQIAAEKALGDFSAYDDPAACDDWYNGDVKAVDFEDGLLYVAAGHAGCEEKGGVQNWSLIDEGGLWIVDVSNPAEPVPIGFLPMGDVSIYDVKVAGNYAYLAASVEGLKIVDVSDPVKPTLVGGHDTPVAANAVAVEDDVAYLMDWNTVQIFDVANPAKPVRIGMMAEDFYSLRDIAVRAGYIYLTGNNYGLPESSFYVLRLIDPQARPGELLWGASSD